MDLNEYLSKPGKGPVPCKGLKDVITCIAGCASQVSDSLRTAVVGKSGLANQFGDKQLNVDLIADGIIFAELQKLPCVRAASSEETVELKELNKNGEFVVCFDPLDGSSVIDCNFTVGTIVAIWQIGVKDFIWMKEDTMIGAVGRQQVASALILYGPRTTMIVGVHEDNGVVEFTLGSSGKWKMTRDETRCNIPEDPDKRFFSPANLRCSMDLNQYWRMIEYWVGEKYTLRYSGAMVPDVYQMFVKNAGVFCNPSCPESPAKLRLLYECVAVARLTEMAGGASSDGNKSVQDVKIVSMQQRIPLFCVGAKTEVERFNDEMNASWIPQVEAVTQWLTRAFSR